MTRQHRLILGGLFFVLMFVYAGTNAYQSFEYRKSAVGWSAALRGGRVVVENVDEAGRASLLRPGDEIVAFDGRAVESAYPIFELPHSEPGRVYTVVVRRGTETFEFSFQTTPLPPFRVLFDTLLAIVIPVIFLVLGFAVFVLKPEDKQAVLMALMFGTFLPVELSFYDGLPPPLAVLMIVCGVASSLFPALFFHFFLVFPENSRLLRRYPRLERWLYAPVVLFTLPVVLVVSVVQYVAPERFFAWEEWIAPLTVAATALTLLYIFAGVWALLANYKHASRQSRRKMRMVVVGCVMGFLPSVLMFAIYFYGAQKINASLLGWLSAGSVLAFTLFPLSLAYAIVRHQVIPVRLIIRRGIRYVFISQGSVVLEVVAVSLALIFFLDFIIDSISPARPLVVGVISGVFSVLVWHLTSALHHSVVAPTIDRRFFRRAYNAQQVLSDLGQELRLMADVREITGVICTKMQDALQTESASVFLLDDVSGDFVCVISSHHVEGGRVTADQGLVLPGDAFVVQRLREAAQALVVDFEDKYSWANMLLSEDVMTNDSRRRESETLRRINAALLLPIATKEELLGVISLGPRLGDLPFSRQDRQMLMAISWQVAFAIANSRLVRKKVEEERLRRELEMATEVQRRLFPERPPECTTLELAGVCHPASGVGGDYYDFLPLGGGQVGVAVADVAGKGISAALLMSTVQASLRSQAHTVGGRLTELVSSMNRLLNRSTGSSSYATFFYAQFDERTRTLTYVNAGHNPPILVRASSAGQLRDAESAATSQQQLVAGAAHAGSTATTSLLSTQEPEQPTATTGLLTTGGPVIGLFDEFTYEQETVQTERGDLIVAYTDGVTEALNPKGVEFGEARLHALVTEQAHLSAEELTNSIIETLRRWCRDTPQHDDMTLVVMKVK
ncbi:MAG TPA: SpoIIE family protein phosphatase [Pyrinomonadaceae bacterium]|nr:SpoIIE family protein phosphatase [Pyrinomonadaceae bacterium]